MAVKLYAHLSWTTDGRRRTIGPGEEGFLRRFLPAEAMRHDTEVVAMGIVAEHVHLILRLPSLVNIPRLVQGLKGASARLVNKDLTLGRKPLQWAKGYDLRSVSPDSLNHAVAYVKTQAQRHPERAIGQR
jgi:putative transposase